MRFAPPVIVMDREVIDVRTRCAQHGAIPFHVVITDGDQLDRWIDSAHCFGVTIVITRVSLGVGVTSHPVAPDLISDSPKFYVERRWMTVRRAHRAILRA